MVDVCMLTTERLTEMLHECSDDALLDEIYDELERRERDLELRDWTESDAAAAWSERYELLRREY